MKKLIGIAVLVISFPAFAIDLVTSVSATCGAVSVSQVNTFKGLTEAQQADMVKRGLKVLDFANKHADKGGPCVMTWKWGNEPQLETAGMKPQAVNRVLKQEGVKFLKDHADLK